MKLVHLPFLALLFLSSLLKAQMPETDIWLFDLKQVDNALFLTNPINFTNRPGYDNQPVFSADGKYILYTSYRDGQSDIYKYNIDSATTTAFCKTPESEYSPAFTPDGQYVSVVRVEKDSTQRIWKFPVNGGEPSLVLKDVPKVGYYSWVNNDSLIVFLLTHPESINAVSIKKQKPLFLAANAGRCFMADAQGVFFINKENEKAWRFDRISDKGTRALHPFGLSELPTLTPGYEDFVVLKNDDYSMLFMGKGAMLYQFVPSQSSQVSDCVPLQDLSGFGIKNITRMAISRDGKRIAVVSAN